MTLCQICFNVLTTSFSHLSVCRFCFGGGGGFGLGTGAAVFRGLGGARAAVLGGRVGGGGCLFLGVGLLFYGGDSVGGGGKIIQTSTVDLQDIDRSLNPCGNYFGHM